MVEQILDIFNPAYVLKSVFMRYFNTAGADPAGRICERHEQKPHLIPLILEVASGRWSVIKVFSRDCDTSNGTCVRDFFHVVDIVDAHAHAHVLALYYLKRVVVSAVFNLGNGDGFSIH
jgi:UDP-glucose 4-epimerase